MPFLIAQRALKVPFFFKVTVPFFVPGVNTSNNWLYSFLNRWSDRIASLKPRSLESNRAKSSSPGIVEKYYSKFKGSIREI